MAAGAGMRGGRSPWHWPDRCRGPPGVCEGGGDRERGGASLQTLCAGRCRLGSEKDSLRVGEAGFCTRLGAWVWVTHSSWGGWSLGVRAVCLAAGGRGEGGRLERSVLAIFMGVVSYGTSSHLGVLALQGCGSMYKHAAHVTGSRGEKSVEVH